MWPKHIFCNVLFLRVWLMVYPTSKSIQHFFIIILLFCILNFIITTFIYWQTIRRTIEPTSSYTFSTYNYDRCALYSSFIIIISQVFFLFQNSESSATKVTLYGPTNRANKKLYNASLEKWNVNQNRNAYNFYSYAIYMCTQLTQSCAYDLVKYIFLNL